MTYREQLLHPNWQKKRLEMLEAAGWECSSCGNKDQTLHVHHRQYMKGRMAWEYSEGELEVLCEDCHQHEHATDELLKEILLLTNLSENTALVAGFHRADDHVEAASDPAARGIDRLAYAAGFVAYLTYNLADIDKMKRVAAFAASLHREEAEPRLRFEHSRGDTFGESA